MSAPDPNCPATARQLRLIHDLTERQGVCENFAGRTCAEARAYIAKNLPRANARVEWIASKLREQHD